MMVLETSGLRLLCLLGHYQVASNETLNFVVAASNAEMRMSVVGAF
jgi:hypothetical protein